MTSSVRTEKEHFEDAVWKAGRKDDAAPTDGSLLRAAMKSLLRSHPVMLALVVALTALYLGLRADQGWIPHDEGLLAGAAERVLAGELPHRDFDDTYTGGLALLHALALRLMGIHLLSLRMVLLVFALLFTAVVYRIAARAASPLVAALVTLTAVAWSVPNYFAGMPSWYNLFFSGFGTLALLKYLETDRRRWLFAAGVCGALSCLMKSVGLYYVAAVLLLLVYRQQVDAKRRETAGRTLGFSVFTLAGLLFFVVLLLGVFSRRAAASDIVLFVVPGLGLAIFLAAESLRLGRAASSWRRLLVPGAIFLAGLALPVGLYLVPYLATASLGELLTGVFVLPLRRFEYAATLPPGLAALGAAVPVGLLLLPPLWRRAGRVESALLVPAIALLGLGVACGGHREIYTVVWHSVRPLVPITTLAGCLILVRGSERPPSRRLQLFLILSMAAMTSLVQFPFVHGIYFCYTAPWVVLAMLFLVAEEPRLPRRLLVVVLGFYLAFAVVWLNRGFPPRLGVEYTRVEQTTPMGLERGGLRISAPKASLYAWLIDEVRARSADGAFIYAAPDCPEVYFLSGRRNPTRTFYDFLEPDAGDPEGRVRRILALLEEHAVEVVVLHWRPEFSAGIDRRLAAEIFARYPRHAELVPFTVHWRESSPSSIDEDRRPETSGVRNDE